VKDNFCMSDGEVPTTAGSRALEGFVSPFNATVVARLREAGAVIVGKTNMDEFGMGSMGTNSYAGPVRSPWQNGDVVAGGSSAGSAVAVATGSCLGSIGSDTGGSVRLPAAYCGVVGVKPTYGRVSRHGLIAYASSLDCPGLHTTSVKDAALLLEAIAGYDHQDPTSSTVEVSKWSQKLPDKDNAQPLQGLRIGIPKAFAVQEMSNDMAAAWREAAERAAQAGAEVCDVELPLTKYALSTYYTIATSEAASNLARYDGIHYGFSHRDASSTSNDQDLYLETRTRAFGPEVQRRILVGSFALSSEAYSEYFEKAQCVRRLLLQEMSALLSGSEGGPKSAIDALIIPSALGDAPLGVATDTQTPEELYLNDIMTVPASLAGLPAVSIPVGLSSQDLPLGMQVISQAFDEQMALNVASCLHVPMELPQ